MPSTAERLSDLAHVKGYLIPVFSDDVIPGREQRHGLTREDFALVVAGYACGRCLAYFDTYMPVCPSCFHHRDVHADVVRAHDWEQHLRDRRNAEENPHSVPRALPMHRLVEQAMKEQM